MTRSIILKKIYFQAAIEGEKYSRSADEQFNYWARLGKACLDNPELPTPFVVECLESLEESRSGQLSPLIPRTDS
ncbi:MAG: hypothetical protein Q7K13_05660 [Polynucleobacter sp.]|uniref:TA system antitoxin ParD family protein n=1 Tax=Polynucleobacter sp. TaxID=2029855 RepID=UPI002721CF9B|nr:hypothetical protein [Polynucleobacter sp.]MDO8713949.1 hypothetical protein [Polynucleobacter sp.]